MPKADLCAAFVRHVTAPEKGKIDYFSNDITGFVLEVRSSGGKTYYLRYRDVYGKQCQHKIGMRNPSPSTRLAPLLRSCGHVWCSGNRPAKIGR